jgi:pimeloyl-ACP methyl ester carboxylesterase
MIDKVATSAAPRTSPPMRAPPLPDPLNADRRELSGRAGRMALWRAGQGAPALLVHSINAAGSAYEIRPAFEAIVAVRRAYAPDLPGFGASDRSERRYDVPLFVSAIDDALDAIAEECGDAPVDVLALSLSSEFAARVAVRRPERVRTLTLVNPTGLDRRSASLRGPSGTDREVPGVHRVLSQRLWSQALFDALTSRPSVRYFLQRTWGSKSIDEGLREYSWTTARQPGARHAPLAFLSGRLFSKDIRDVYERLAMPVWVPHGTRGDFKDFSGADWTASRGNWRLQAFESGALPHFEHPAAFGEAFRAFVEAA